MPCSSLAVPPRFARTEGGCHSGSPSTHCPSRWCHLPKRYRTNGKTTPQACNEAAITVQTYYRWRKEYGGLKLEQAKRMKDLEKENGRLKRLVAELSLEKQVLKDVAAGNF